jgi:hypothetical protein
MDSLKDYEVAIFAEVNEHMRNTEQKQLSISVAFIGVVAVVLSVLPNDNGKLLSPSPMNFFVYTLLGIMGCTVYAIQRWYRAWKEHYMGVARAIVTGWKVSEKLCPCWMILPVMEKKRILSPKVDNLSIYFTGVLNTFLVVFGSYRWLQWWQYTVFAWVSTALVIALYSCFMRWATLVTVYGREGHSA